MRKGSAHLVELDPLVGDEDELVPAGPTETQNDGVLHLQVKGSERVTPAAGPESRRGRDGGLPYTPV